VDNRPQLKDQGDKSLVFYRQPFFFYHLIYLIFLVRYASVSSTSTYALTSQGQDWAAAIVEVMVMGAVNIEDN
jgi:hypothetical protein